MNASWGRKTMRDALKLYEPLDALRLIVESACPGEIGLWQLCDETTDKDMDVDKFEVCARCWIAAIKHERGD